MKEQQNLKVKESAEAGMDATELLELDHRSVEKLFKDYEQLIEQKADAKKRTTLATTICNALTVHAEIEEQLFYPAAKKEIDETDLIFEAAVEHTTMKFLISEMSAASKKDALFDAHVKVLSEYVSHHVKEEEKELFPKVRKTKLDLNALGSKMVKLKANLSNEK
jgi:hemerythrin superfamily protein